MGKRGLVDFQLLLCWIGATDHINHGVVRLWCPIGVPIAQVIQYEYQKKRPPTTWRPFATAFWSILPAPLFGGDQ